MYIYTKSRASCFTHSGHGGQYSVCVCVCVCVCVWWVNEIPMKVSAYYCMRVHGLIHSNLFTTKKIIFYWIENEKEKNARLQLKMVNKSYT